MRVDAVMTKTVATIRVDAPIADAIGKLIEHRISGLPVLNGVGRLVGMVTEGDLLRRVELGTQHHPPKWLGFLKRGDKAAQDKATKDYVRDRTKRVGDIMTRDPVSVDETASLEDVVALMERHGVRRVPVVARGGLVGIVSRSDLVHLLGQVMRDQAMQRRADGVIQEELLAELAKQPWFKGCKVSVQVHEGKVRVKGEVDQNLSETALRAAAESTLGVLGVEIVVSIIGATKLPESR